MNKILEINVFLFCIITIIVLNLLSVYVIDLAYGHEIIFLHKLNNINRDKVEFLQFSSNSENSQSPSGNLHTQSPQQQQSPSGNLQTQSPQQQLQQQQSPSGNLQTQSPQQQLNNYNYNNNYNNNNHRLMGRYHYLYLKNYKDYWRVYHRNFQMI